MHRIHCSGILFFGSIRQRHNDIVLIALLRNRYRCRRQRIHNGARRLLLKHGLRLCIYYLQADLLMLCIQVSRRHHNVQGFLAG